MKRFQLLTLLILYFHYSLFSQCDPVRDSLALVDFHNSTLDFFSWYNQTNWLVEGQPIETWYGVTTNNDGCVTQIRLPDNIVASSIPSSIGNLSELEVLDLSRNPIENISAAIGNLSKLRILNLNYTSIDDLPQNFENLQSLEVLDLSRLCCTPMELPPEILKLSTLKSFKMNGSNLVGTIPPELGNLPNLDTLWLHENNFEGCISEEFRSLCSSSVRLYANPLLPWQGDFDSFCNNNSQIGAICNNGAIASCLISRIDSQCECVTDNSISYPNPIVDSLALVDLFYNNNGFDWDEKTNWLVRGKPIGTWYGVTTNDEGYVTCLDLDGDPGCNWHIINGISPTGGNNLDHELTNSIGCFSELTFLSIAGDLVWGEIPNSIVMLKNLKSLNLSNTNLSGEIPSDIHELSELETLAMVNNSLRGEIPNAIGQLTNLKQLLLAQNYLLGESENLPDFLSNLTKLENIQIDRCRFSGELPAFIGDLPFINTVRLSGNNFSGCFPESYTNLCGINHVDFSGNPKLPWEGAFENFCNNDNQIGAFCNDGNTSTNSTINDVCFCSDSDILTNKTDSLALVALFNSTNGEEWDNNDNWLVVGAPIYTWEGISLDENGRVIKINLFRNNLNGILPSEIGILSELITLQLCVNNLSGVLPPEINQLSNLNILDLGGNNFNGILLPEIKHLSNLKVLDLGGNSFIGKIPNEIGFLSKLERLNLGGNNFLGKIPNEIGLLSQLEELDLGPNMLEGEIPSEIGLLTKLEYLSLSSNKLSGEIPSELGNLESIEEMHLSSNNFYGCIPENLMSVCNEFITIWWNPLLPWSGDFDRFCNEEPQIGAFCDDGNPNTTNDVINDDCSCGNTCNRSDSLALIDLYENTNGEHWVNTWDIAKPYTTWFGVSTNEVGCVDGLTLINNNLDGILPNSIVDMSNLEVLILDNNNLTGTIPDGFGNIGSLQVFRLNNNNLNGCFPDDLLTRCDFISASFTNNPLLPWEGDFEGFCNSEDKISAECTDSITTSIIENNWIYTFDVYPNPTTLAINFDFQKDMNLSTLSCTNIWGQNMAVNVNVKDDLVTLDMSNLSSGLYFISILGEHKSYISKLVVR